MPPQSRYEFDRAYIERLIAEDAETERHFTKYFGALLALKLGHRLRSRALVEDATQETFVRVLTTLKRKGGLETPEGLGAFVNSVCNNVLFEMYRAGSRADQLDEEQERIDEGHVTAEAHLMSAQEQEQVRRALVSLPEKDRELLRWLFFDEQDKNEICRRLNVDRGYLRVLLHRAKLRFREQFLSEAAR